MASSDDIAAALKLPNDHERSPLPLRERVVPAAFRRRSVRGSALQPWNAGSQPGLFRLLRTAAIIEGASKAGSSRRSTARRPSGRFVWGGRLILEMFGARRIDTFENPATGSG
jgi:hypothetical protein